MRYKRDTGATLSLVIACALIIVIIGVAFFALVQQLGGGKQLEYATQFGNLNVARQAPNRVGVTLNPARPFENVLSVYRDPLAGNTFSTSSFSPAIGHALVALMRAEADGSAAAIASANGLIGALEQGSDSVGGRLKARLASRSLRINPLLGAFSDTAITASLRNFGGNPLDHLTASYDVAYVEQNAGNRNEGATNIQASGNEWIPFTGLPEEDTRVQSPEDRGWTARGADGGTYMKGHMRWQIPGVGTLWSNVLSPRLQPRRIGQDLFVASRIQPGLADGIHYPNNAFLNRAETLDNRSGSRIAMNSTSEEGTSEIRPIGINLAYVEINNGPSRRVTGTIPSGSNTVNENELMYGISTRVNGEHMFSIDGSLEKLAGGTQIESGDYLFHEDGTRMTPAETQPYIGNVGPIQPCYDYNSSEDENGVQPCIDMLTAAKRGEGWQLAYHGGLWEPNNINVEGLTSQEMSNYYLLTTWLNRTWEECIPICVDRDALGNPNYGPTGMGYLPDGNRTLAGTGEATQAGFYAPDGEASPWSPVGAGFDQITPGLGDPRRPFDITKDGSLYDLANQTGRAPYYRGVGEDSQLIDQDPEPGKTFADGLGRSLFAALRTIKSSTTVGEFERLYKYTPIPISNAPYYIYLNAFGSFVLTQVPPPALAFTGGPVPADGTLHYAFKQWDDFKAGVNPENLYGVHDFVYMAEDMRDILRTANLVGFNQNTGSRFNLMSVRAQTHTKCVNMSVGLDQPGGRIIEGAPTGVLNLCERN